MAERKEPGLWNSLKKGAVIGAVALLGIESALLLGVPALLINTILNVAATGALWGGLIGGAIGLIQEAGRFLTAEPKKA